MELHKEDKPLCEIEVQEKKNTETTRIHPEIDVLTGIDIRTISTQKHQLQPLLTHP